MIKFKLAQPESPRRMLSMTKAASLVRQPRSIYRSNSLARLRGHLDVELFLRDPEGFRPTLHVVELSALSMQPVAS